MVDDLDNRSELAGVQAILDEDDTADLYEAPLRTNNSSVTHSDGVLWFAGSARELWQYSMLLVEEEEES